MRSTRNSIFIGDVSNIKKTARVYVNGRFLTQPVTGVQRYALELMRAFDKLLGDNNFSAKLKLVCLVPPQDFPNPSWKNMEIQKIGKNTGNIWEQFDLPSYLSGQLLFSPANIGPWYYSNQLVTLHDASVFAIPEAYSFTFRLKYKLIFRQLAKRVEFFITNSEFSRQELARYLKISPERFLVTPLGSDHMEYIEADQHILDRKKITSNTYFLLVASHSKHKNYDAVIRAVNLLRKQKIKIVMVGGNYQQVFKKNELVYDQPNNLDLGYVTDQELKTLYENALGFIAPSLYEGFGLPVLEAMRAGCPVISSHAAALPEVAGDAALYFDPYDVLDIAKVIKHFLSNPGLRNDMRKKGYKQVERFTWSITAQQTLETIWKLHKNDIVR